MKPYRLAFYKPASMVKEVTLELPTSLLSLKEFQKSSTEANIRFVDQQYVCVNVKHGLRSHAQKRVLFCSKTGCGPTTNYSMNECLRAFKMKKTLRQCMELIITEERFNQNV